MDLDLNSFQIVASIHYMNPGFIGNDRIMEFIFQNILLRDSSTNESASHGFVRYRILPGDTLKNQAAIYFDFNAPVLTNVATTEIVVPVGIYEIDKNFTTAKIFSNHVSENVHIKLMGISNQNIEVSMYNIYGQLIENIYSGSVSEDRFVLIKDLQKLSAGMYLIKISSQSEEANFKFVKY